MKIYIFSFCVFVFLGCGTQFRYTKKCEKELGDCGNNICLTIQERWNSSISQDGILNGNRDFWEMFFDNYGLCFIGISRNSIEEILGNSYDVEVDENFPVIYRINPTSRNSILYIGFAFDTNQKCQKIRYIEFTDE